MEKGRGVDVQKWVISTHRIGNEASVKVGLGSSLLLSNYPALAHLELCQRLPSGAQSDQFLTLAELEMLEAELKNRGITERPAERAYTLAQFAAYAQNVIRWKARRRGVRLPPQGVLIDVPKFLLQEARRCLSLSDSSDALPPPDRALQLDYFERLGEILLCAEPAEASDSSRDTKLDLVLRILTRSHQYTSRDAAYLVIPQAPPKVCA